MQGSPTSNMSDIITMKSDLGIPICFVTIKYLKKANLLYKRLTTAGAWRESVIEGMPSGPVPSPLGTQMSS